MNRSQTSTLESDRDLLVVHSPFKGDIGIGRIIHIEPAGPFAQTRAQATAEEYSESVGWGNMRLLNWIGDVVDAPDPQVGKFTLFDELYAAPKTHINQLVELFARETQSLQKDQKPSLDLDI